MIPNDPHGGSPGWYGKNPGEGQGKGEDAEASSTQIAGDIHHMEEGQQIAGNLRNHHNGSILGNPLNGAHCLTVA